MTKKQQRNRGKIPDLVALAGQRAALDGANVLQLKEAPAHNPRALVPNVHGKDVMKRIGYNVYDNGLYNSILDNPDPIVQLEKNGILIFEDMSRHPVAAACLSALFNPIFAMDWEVVPNSEDAEDTKRADHCRDTFMTLNSQLWRGNAFLGGFPAFLGQILEGVRMGYSVTQAIWNATTAQIVETKHEVPQAFTWLSDEEEAVQNRWSNQYTGTTLHYFPEATSKPIIAPDYKFMHFVYNPRYGNPRGDSILTRAYWCYIFGWVDGMKMELNLLDKWSMPTLMGLVEKTHWTNNDIQQGVMDAMKKFQMNYITTVPMLESGQPAIQILESQRTSSNDLIMNFIDSMHRLMAIAIIGAPLTIMEAQFGTRAQASEQQEVRRDIIKGVVDYVMAQVMIPIMWMCDLKFGRTDSTKYPTFKLKYEDPVDEVAMLEVDQGLQLMGGKFSRNDIEQRYGRKFANLDPAKGDVEEVLEPLPQPQNQNPFGFSDKGGPDNPRYRAMKASELFRRKS